MGKEGKFQIKLSGEWKDYEADEDKILKRAFLGGYPNASYRLRGNHYLVDFKNMKQVNKATGKGRDIRPPYRWTPPAAPVVPKGPTTCVTVPPGAPGTVIQVPHPQAKGEFISVEVPPTAKVGQAMLVPIPPVTPSAPSPYEPGPTPSAPYPTTSVEAPAAADAPAAEKKKEGLSTGAKVAMGAGGVAVVGGAVAGGLLGAHIAEAGWDDAMADLGDGAGTVGDAIADGAEAAGHWVGGAADTAGDFIMDLF
mmetsp:Transcript_22170/g.63562  ORF Transcript_22170/g.63562 Transcript_22170/m.63562 type:complete len:252 (+) Transcript_22170:57-812(+)